MMLSSDIHSRSFEHYQYVYPVVSRRAHGVSIGINLNLNKTCNWRCVYCQVNDLTRGKPAVVNLLQLKQELIAMLNAVLYGDFMQRYVEPDMQRLNDIALSGDGEPTLSPNLVHVIQLIASIRGQFKLPDSIKTILITNGSQLHIASVQQAIKILATQSGCIWFKIDRATVAGINQVNQVSLSLEAIKTRVILASKLCSTFIQSCWFNIANNAPEPSDITAFVAFMVELKQYIEGVLLYSIARAPALPEGISITPIADNILHALAEQLQQCEIQVFLC